MKVVLLFSPTNAEAINILYAACRQCYSSGFVGDSFPFSDVPTAKKQKLLEDVLSSGHHSVLEHVSFVFGISELSRAAAQQLTRHRIASYSMQSQRYCNVSKMNVQIGDSIKKKTKKI